MSPGPLPVGTVVDYHGSQAHGRYVITEHQDIREDGLFRPSELAAMAASGEPLEARYPDGVAYVIWPEGLAQKFGNRDRMVWRVRRSSLTPIDPLEEARP